MAKMVTINLFDIDGTPQTSQKLSDTIDEYMGLALDKRWRNDIRLDQITKVPKNRQTGMPELYHLDFSKKREVGPGKLGNAVPVSGIQMRKDEDFGEETAAIYVPAKKWLLILNNQAGIGPSRMAEYLNAVDPGNEKRHFDYSASPCLDSTILKRLGGMRNLTSLDITATVDALSATQDNVGLAVAQATKPTQAKRISITFAANSGRKKVNFLSSKPIKDFVNKLRAQGDGVTVLKVKGEDPTTGKKDQVIDLLEHKMKRQFRADELQIIDHRYTIQSRWQLLDRALRAWI